MTVGTADVVSPVLAAPEVIVLFLSRVTRKTGFGGFLRRLAFERNDLFRITFFDVRLAWSMTRFTASHFVVPTADLRELGVRRVRESLELIFVAIFAGIAADVVVFIVGSRLCLAWLRCLRRRARGQPHRRCNQRNTKQQRLNDSVYTHLTDLTFHAIAQQSREHEPRVYF